MLNPGQWLFLAICSLSAQASISEETSSPENGMAEFPHLMTLKPMNIGVTLYYADDASVVLTASHPHAKEIEDAGVYIARPLRTQLLGDGKGYFTIDCDSGGSADPQCTILQESDGQLKALLSIPGLRFAFPANGDIYVDGHSNTMFNQRRKFEWTGVNFVEVQQAFRYVGLDTTTRETITLYSGSGQEKIVAVLPQGSPVSVLVNEGDRYLLKTPFGLVGWTRIAEGVQDASPINGLYYAGD